jgi:hypothetical protein
MTSGRETNPTSFRVSFCWWGEQTTGFGFRQIFVMLLMVKENEALIQPT